MGRHMRNPGYRRAEGEWGKQCDVLFNGIDFGPNLLYKKFRFTPASNRRSLIQIAGMPGKLDCGDSPAGYMVPEPLHATLELWVTNPAAWGMPGPPDGMSPESRFIQAVTGKTCKIEFYSSNGFYLNAACEVAKYERFDLGFPIELRLECEPYFWEETLTTFEWNLRSASSRNVFDPESAIINTETLPPEEYCVWAENLSQGGGRYVLHASPGGYADIHISGLTASLHYIVALRKIYSAGHWELYDGQGNVIREWPFTGVTEIILRLISRSSRFNPVGFADIWIEPVGPIEEAGTIQTLDAPLRSLTYTANAPCTLLLGNEPIELTVGENMKIYGINIPPRTQVPVSVYSAEPCMGYIAYRRGSRTCTR